MNIIATILGLVFAVGNVQFEMTEIPGGAFLMGGTKEQQSETGSTDLPVHRVAVSSYYIGKTEVTRRLWKAVMGEDSGDWLAEDLPIEWVSWEQCQVFIHRLDSITGQPFRLPTEAEWEYAARGGNGKQYHYAGSNDYDPIGWLYLNSQNRTHAVAQKAPNGFGLYDMTGNVAEWCADWYGAYSAETQIDPTGPKEGKRRVVRGSSWDTSTLNARLSAREGRDPSYSFYDCGLRLAMDGQKGSETNNRLFPTMKAGQDSVMKIHVAGQTIKMLRVPGSKIMMSETEVTQSLWKALMKKNPSSHKGGSLPVNGVSKNDCQDFIYKLDSLSGYTFRLPTEEEWMYAAQGGNRGGKSSNSSDEKGKKQKTAKYKKRKNIERAAVVTAMIGVHIDVPEDATLALFNESGTQHYAYAGSDYIDEVGWYNANSKQKLHPVKQKKPNEIGLYDMTGNVSEWTTTIDSVSGKYLVLGGCFISSATTAMLSEALHLSGTTQSESCGFRLVLEIDE